VYDFRPSSITREFGTHDFNKLASYGLVSALIDIHPLKEIDKVDII